MRSIKALRHLLAASALVALAPGFADAQMRGIGQPQLQPQGPSRLIDVIDIDERESQVDITLQFNCSLHYAGHAPASSSTDTASAPARLLRRIRDESAEPGARISDSHSVAASNSGSATNRNR